jgi:predicted phosphohydrolase
MEGKLTEEQINVIKCAFMDLRGSYHAYETMDIHGHDWKGHKQSILELMEEFDFLSEMVDTALVSGND